MKKQQSVMDRVRGHFSSKEHRIIEAPEWGSGTSPLMIYCTPVTLLEKNKLYKLSKNDDLSFMVDLLIMKAKDASGQPIFSLADRPELMRCADPDVIARISEQIMQTDSMQQAEKN